MYWIFCKKIENDFVKSIFFSPLEGTIQSEADGNKREASRFTSWKRTDLF